MFKVFGTSLTAERLVALLQQIGVVMGVYALARHWGRTVALPCALISLVIIVPPIGLTALGWVGGVALGLLGLAVALEGRRIADPRRAGRYALLGGVLLGFALLYRLDLILAVGLAVLVMLRGLDRARAKRLLGGVALGASPYVIQLATAGVGATVSGMILDPVIYLRGGRRLPIPPPWDHLDGFLQRAGNIQQLSWPVPSFSTAQQLTIWFFFLLATVLFLLFVARWRLRQDRTAFNPRVLATVAVFSLGLMPQAHPAGRLGALRLGELRAHRLPPDRGDRGAPGLEAAPPRAGTERDGGCGRAALPVRGVAVLHDSHVHRLLAAELRLPPHRVQDRVQRAGSSTTGDPKPRRAANELLPVADRISKPGDRLFVGPTDLRKTPYSDAYLYYMLPDLNPATYYIEMDPGVANGPGSRLASDLRSADIAILSSVWNDWDEPNDARKFGSNRPNEVLKRDFCLVQKFGRGGVYELYRRCNK